MVKRRICKERNAKEKRERGKNEKVSQNGDEQGNHVKPSNTLIDCRTAA